MAAAWPGLMWYLGWRLTAAADASELCKAVGAGLTETARVFLALELLRHICCHRGLGESHFGWPAAALKLLRQNIRWFSLPVLPLMCVAVAMAWQENDRWDASLGRICFIAALLCFSLALHRVLRPASVVFQAMIAARRGGWLDRFRYVWYPLCTLTPAVLAILAAAGYHYTARQLVIRLILTAYVLVGGVVCRALAAAMDVGEPAQAGHRAGPASGARPPRTRAMRAKRSAAPRSAGLDDARTRSGHDQHPDPPAGRILAGRGLWRWPSGVRGSTCCRP